MMDLNSHYTHDNLFTTSQLLMALKNIFKEDGLAVVANKEKHSRIRRSSSFEQLSSSDSEEDDASKNNPYYTAYAKLLLEFKKENAVAYRAALQRLNLIRQNIDDTTVDVTDAIDDIGNEPHVKRKPSQTVIVKPKRLNDIMNIDLLLDKSWTQKSEIWFDYFTKRDETLVAVIPFKEFRDFYRQSLNYPMFILQLSRENGQGELIFIQFECFDEHTVSNSTVHLTPVTSYKTYKENAPECMTVEYYTDFCNSNIFSNNEESCVLMRATYNGKLLSSSEAKCLINTLDCFYQNFCEIKEMEKLLRLFNKGVKPFKHFDVTDLVKKLK